MTPPPDLSVLKASAQIVHSSVALETVSKAVICGSGWGNVVEDLEVTHEIPFTELPGMGATGVKGHAGLLVFGKTEAGNVMVFKGRRHFYEGEGWTPIALPIFLCLQFKVPDLLLTNSAGAIHPDFQVGDLMMITDHLNLMGENPLVGPHEPLWGPRFPDLSHVYGPEARAAIAKGAASAGVSLQQGVYAATRGPIYETPAEVQAWKTLGADAVGMSTVPEAILAHAAGIQVTGLSCMTNFAAGISPHPLTHEEVTASTQEAMPRMKALVKAWLDQG